MSWINPSEYDPNEICALCQEEYGITTGIYKTDCNHIFHNDCLNDYCKHENGEIKCPLCRSDIEDACNDVWSFKNYLLGSASGKPLFNGNQHIQDIYNKNNPSSSAGKRNKRPQSNKIKKTKRKINKNRKIRTKRRRKK